MNIGYIKRTKLGEGSYAIIYLADEVETIGEKVFIEETEECVLSGKKVAIKSIKPQDYCPGIDVSAIREIKALKKIQSPYVLKLFNVFIHENRINLVLEYLETSLDVIITNKNLIIMPQDIKSWILMILKGIFALHKKFIVHRDIKPQNILISRNGIIKIADFGLSRDIDCKNMTSNVVTRFYRAPELIMGCEFYTFSIDIWAIGCVFAELFLRVPFFSAESDIGMLDVIFRALGTPTKQDWPGMCDLPNYLEYPVYPSTTMKHLFTAASEDTLDLLKSMLTYDPLKRITVLKALNHRYFKELPRPTLPENLPFPQ